MPFSQLLGFKSRHFRSLSDQGWLQQHFLRRFLVLILAAVSLLGVAGAADPPPSITSTVGQAVINPVTNAATTVQGFIFDPDGTTKAFVRTNDGYVFLLKTVGEKIFNNDTPAEEYVVVSKDTATNAVVLRSPANTTTSIAYGLTYTTFQTYFQGADEEGATTPPVLVSGVNGVRIVNTGKNGSNGRDGALFVSPRSGGNGATGPTTPTSPPHINSINISTTNKIGIEIGSIGGRGGDGGTSYLSWHSGKSGGNGGAGGTVSLINDTGIQVSATGDEKHGIFAYSRSGRAGNGGDGILGGGGGSGGFSNNGGDVTVVNRGLINTTGIGANGIYGLSVSNNGGNGGDSWGFVGTAGDGNYGGGGGLVTITNAASGSIFTTGLRSNGILAQSIGGTGGSSGLSANLILSLSGDADDGGDGGIVRVINDGSINTTGDQSRGIFAQSIGGGGGTGGDSFGLVALGGSGSFGGDAGEVSVTNGQTGSIRTTGLTSDGIFAQSSGGSGGSGSDAGGLVAVGGSGAGAGNGGIVNVINYGSIMTTRDASRGIVAQSIGGGGGDGGNSGGMVSVGGTGQGGGFASAVSVLNGGSIRTSGKDSVGIFTQSVGGGGGNGGSSGSVGAFVGVAVGGNGGGGGEGGNVNVTLQGVDATTSSLIKTRDDRSGGVFAQSVGGGGGNGGGAIQVTAGFGAAASFAVGGKGGLASNGGIVTLSKGVGSSVIETDGADSTGVFLQSVGGGGGNGGYAVAVAASGGPVSGSLSVGIGGKAGAGGAGGVVSVGQFNANGVLTNTGFNGSIWTKGDRSTGFLAQSVGGGGGNGGLAVAAAGSGSLLFSGSIGISLGGDGAGGGVGGKVSVGTEGDITTQGNHATGLLIQSVGGGGGNGGGSIAASLAGSGGGAGTLSIALGGNASDGSRGGDVSAATRSGAITTQGSNSTGILVQSVGGGGGNGGYSIAAGAAGAGVGAGAVNVGLGGKGGGGGDGGNVQADLQSDVTTSSVVIARALDPVSGDAIPEHYAANSPGIVVQSVGGGGGNGGFAVAAGASGAGVGSGAVSVSLGGAGATGGRGGSVNATSTGAIQTKGDRSGGFIAQSIGGGGGNGGFSVNVAGSGAGVGSGAIAVGLGGSGGAGNHAGAVEATTSIGSITTTGNDSIGVIAQSIGGGGGNGGFNVSVAASGAGVGSGAVSVGLGGSAGSGGNAGSVMLTVNNSVSTSGKNSAGVVAQAIGGGGGNGGYNVSATGSGAGTGSGAVSVGLGGLGSLGGTGGTVNARVTGNVETLLENSTGILAQSVGGGGGNGGYNLSLAGSGAGVGSGSISVGLGGSGAGGGDGLRVDAVSQGTVKTKGSKSLGFIAQSVGGGGGNGAFNLSAALSGAGTGSGAIGVGLGGSGAGGGNGGNGGNVFANTSGSVWTTGGKSIGILTQSVGGGGGNGGFDITIAGSGAGTGSGSIGVSLGGSGAGGGNGNAVDLTVANDVLTEGIMAAGIVAQSVGGGGGNGGFSVAASLSAAGTGSGAVGVSIGGSGGGGGNASTVDSRVTGNVVTKAQGSGGVLSQSVGGGGGIGGMSISGALSFAGTGTGAVSIGIGGSGGAGGSSQKVTSTFTGSVFTDGNDGYGIASQSIGGGGGNGGISISGTIAAAKSGAGALAIGIGGAGGSGGLAGEVNNTVNGYVQTKGNDATGILAQSSGGGGGFGGMNITGSITAAKTGSGSLAFGIGGFGGGGGAGGNVVNNVTGGVLTSGTGSDAIVSQSLGGSGGNGGLNVTGTLNFSKENGGTVGIGIGGFGGDGGNAGTVRSTILTTLTNPSISTIGDNSSAVVAQSLGGGGGNGGINVTGAVNVTGKDGAAVGIGVGGFGGGAGNGNLVDLNVTGLITTYGDQSHGILAQSIGGKGGNGGINVSSAIAGTFSSGGAAKTGAIAIGVGGFGGGGGTGGHVEVDFNGRIYAQTGTYTPATTTTAASFTPGTGEGSHGLVAQSIGGGGGTGGLNVSAGIALSGGKGDGYGLVVGVGGFGGAGGSADSVTVNVLGGQSITSYGKGHSAILAQSIGGGGGSGGTNVSGGITSDSSLLVGVGGFGASAGVGKDVTVTATTNLFAKAISSDEHSAAGLMAQSIGGGGGNGGLNVTGGLILNKSVGLPSVNLGIGGFGGAGASSGDVHVDLTGNATTGGDWVHGIMAQSLAGGGGNGGMNVGGQFNFADSENSGGKTDVSIIAGIGGNAGDGANAGRVDIINNGVINTVGNHARGVIAQSIGGGGGTGGMNVTAIYAKNSSPITVGVGGSGGGGGNSGAVSVTRGTLLSDTGKITTDGLGAHGIEASSIGGGGGDAGMNFNVGFSKVGEGTATSGFAANFIIGGNGAIAGDGDSATVINFSDIETNKDRAYGILAQSIGGGGGNGSFNIGVTHAGASDSAGDKLYNKPNQNMALSLAIGGATGDGGDGKSVFINQRGAITTSGKDAIGILAQSVGGGGGNAGLDVAFVKADGGKAGVTIGRTGGTGGKGGTIELNYLGTLNTTGNGAFGLLAQSIGNGGGNSSSTTISAEVPSDQTDLGETRSQSASLAIGLAGGVGGTGGMVTLNAGGNVTTRGTRAHAVYAQSIGGGGGNGGKANTFGISAAVASVSLGGTGGSGGTGGVVTLTNNAVVRTFGEEAVGLLAQSIGGGGGNGGAAFTGGTKTGDTGVTVGIGGAGGTGMTGGSVTVNNNGTVVTGGLAAHAILAQSIGGGGGDGGMAISAILGLNTASPNSNSATRVAVNVGGNGGTGGDGGAVTVINKGGLGTYKAASVGIFAQSVGGGGGNGKSVLTSSLSGTGGNNLAVSVGGNGGTGGVGGTVTVRNQRTTDPQSGQIITLENQAHGILAMSIGGGGGNGSSVATINRSGKTTGPTAAHQLGLSVGGNGGTGGTGGYVEVENQGSIETRGIGAHGIIAQSIGGGGGNGGMSTSGDLAFGSSAAPANGKTFQIAIGGQGGSGNAGGDVLVTNGGTIRVFGEKSYGIYAQSVGGGGGDGGFATAFSRNLLKNPKGNFVASLSTFALGGFGGSGGDGGDVRVNHTGSIISQGANSYGIFAQSVSGGGGNSALSISSPVWMATNFAIESIIGGTGSSGSAGTAVINTTGIINMLEKNSIAYFSQSVNGGGGNANQFLDFSQQAAELGDNNLPLPGGGGAVDKALAFIDTYVQIGANAVTGAAGALVDATHTGSFFTSGDKSTGGLLQSVGGGGGSSNLEIDIHQGLAIDLVTLLGGKSVSNSEGGNVNLTQTGSTGTMGHQSTGLAVQSIGGGGGFQTITLRTAPDLTVTSFAAAAAAPLVVTTTNLGGDAGTSNNGGVVSSNLTGGTLTTVGDRSIGVIQQSIGGGGGIQILTGTEALNIGVGGKNGASGNGGGVTLINSRAVGTKGTLSHGIVLQSIGGGGGAALTDLDPSLITITKNISNNGNGQDILLTQTGNVVVEGDRSIAIIAQSLGGGGGFVDDLFAGSAGGVGSSGNITLNIDGEIAAQGAGGVGILAQSEGSTTQGNIEISLTVGKRLRFGEDGAGIRFLGGAANHLVNRGIISGKDELEGWAVTGTDGNEWIDNYGILYGQVDLGSGSNRFVNHQDSVVVLGPEFYLGTANNEFVNDGVLIPGDDGLAQRTDMTGAFRQSTSGVTYSELDFGSSVLDGIDMTGSATLAGRLDVVLLNPQLVPSGRHQEVFIHADGGVIDDGMVLTTAPSVVITYDLTYPTGFDAVLDYNVDFSPDVGGSFGRNLQEVGDYFNRIQAVGSSPPLAATVIQLLYAPNLADYKALISQLGPDFYGEQQAEMIRGSQRFGETLLGGGSNRFAIKGRKFWFDFQNAETQHNAYRDYKSTQQQSTSFAIGFEKEFTKAWTAGLGFALADNSASGYEGRWTAEGASQRIGAVVKHKRGGTEIAGTLSYGWNQMDSNRVGQVTTPFATDVQRNLETLTAMMRLSHEMIRNDLFVKPMVDIGITRLAAQEATETGAGATNLHLDNNDQNHAFIRPAIVFGKMVALRSEAKLRLQGSIGYQHYLSGGYTNAVAGFTGAPSGVSPMDVPVELGSVTRLSVGAHLLISNDVDFGIEYTKALGDNFDIDLISLRFSKSF